MKLDLSDAQIKRLAKGHNCTVKYEQMGHGHDFSDAHNSVKNKALKAYQKGKGFVLNGGDIQGCGILHSLRKLGRKAGLSNGDMDAIGSFARPIANTISKGAKQVLVNQATGTMEQLAGAGVLNSLRNLGHKMGLDNGDERAIGNFFKPALGALSKGGQQLLTNVATTGMQTANNAVAGAMAGAGVKKKNGKSRKSGGAINPYLPTGQLTSGGAIAPSAPAIKVYHDGSNLMRSNQAGFAPSADILVPRGNNQSFTGKRGGGFSL